MSRPGTLRLRVLTPTAVLVDAAVEKLVAESTAGVFCMLPRHIDFAAALVPGLLLYLEDGEERFLAVDEGVLVKCAGQVDVSALNAVGGVHLDELRRTVDEEFRELDEHERAARTALARLEAGALRRFIELEERHGVRG